MPCCFCLTPYPPKGSDRKSETGGKRGGSETAVLDTGRNRLLPGVAIEGRGFPAARRTSEDETAVPLAAGEIRGLTCPGLRGG